MHGSCWMLTADMSKLIRVPVMPSRLLYARRHRSMSRRAYSSAQEWLWKPQMSQPHLNLIREKSRKRITWMLIGTLSTPWTCWMSSGKMNNLTNTGNELLRCLRGTDLSGRRGCMRGGAPPGGLPSRISFGACGNIGYTGGVPGCRYIASIELAACFGKGLSSNCGVGMPISLTADSGSNVGDEKGARITCDIGSVGCSCSSFGYNGWSCDSCLRMSLCPL